MSPDFTVSSFSQFQSTGHPAFGMVALVMPSTDPADMPTQVFDRIFYDIGAQEGFVEGGWHL